MTHLDPAFCPDCGTATTTRTAEGRDRAYCEACERVRWRGSVVTTSVAVLDGDSVLLIQRSGGRDAGRWDLPAGHPEYDEPAREGVARELREETALRVAPDALALVGTILGETDELTYRSINYRVDRDDVAGDVEAGSDAADARFVDLAAIRDGAVDVREFGRRRLRNVGVLD